MKNKNKQTKFPVARIKKIMQKDEDVGKVAQATPIVISKALELFLALIVEEASKVTAERGSKKVEAYHLKHAVETTEMFDFLKEIVEGVPDPSAGGTIDLEAEAAEKEKKKKSKGKRAAAAAAAAAAAVNADRTPAAPKRRKKKKDEEPASKAKQPADEGVKSEQDNDTMEEDEDEYDRQRNGMDEDEDEDQPYRPRR
ncbi:histone-like transcription factor (cbf nf-y) [Moniliophthora roreri MCA 2997]|uniref:Histone-like transcription factor (Cbf nf-y) n=2 Tax=Moniliophthora roreri TaxID=221103 RepID=V2WU26_MONRO|nr:histone-like transcription factor (cbf nf-y) [Moniliophthora roreri MCA 2997]KAI3611460.1 histone-like transcription factor (cbf nf-y) [Moniliophthora roreri]